jgi:DNA-binding PadR family transcriptional regulator
MAKRADDGGGVPRGALQAIVLGQLAAGPAHGYALVQTILERTGGAFKLREGTLYPTLHEMELGGLVRARWEVVGGRRRRIYRLTARGEREAKRQRAHWVELSVLLQRLLAGSA